MPTFTNLQHWLFSRNMLLYEYFLSGTAIFLHQLNEHTFSEMHDSPVTKSKTQAVCLIFFQLVLLQF
jgi:hypothetical protein